MSYKVKGNIFIILITILFIFSPLLVMLRLKSIPVDQAIYFTFSRGIALGVLSLFLFNTFLLKKKRVYSNLIIVILIIMLSFCELRIII